jgi:hypothetical protein
MHPHTARANTSGTTTFATVSNHTSLVYANVVIAEIPVDWYVTTRMPSDGGRLPRRQIDV